MRVFVTGGSGFVGAAVIEELVSARHTVLALARSDRSAEAVRRAGAEVWRGSLTDREGLGRALSEAEAAIHTAFSIDLSNNSDRFQFLQSCREEQEAIEAMGAAFAGTERPLLVTSGVMGFAPGHLVTEEDVRPAATERAPRAAEQTAMRLAEQGVFASVVRLPVVHGMGDQGFLRALGRIAREKGSSAYVGEGLNRWPAVHRVDAAVVYRLAVEKRLRGMRWHAIAEEGVRVGAIATLVGQRLGLPTVSVHGEEQQRHFGDFLDYAGTDAPASSERTRQLLGWTPRAEGLLADMGQPGYLDE